MKHWQVVAGIALGATLAGCADKSANIPTPAFKAPGTAQQGAISQPAVAARSISANVLRCRLTQR